MDLDEYQRQAVSTDKRNDSTADEVRHLLPLLGLIGEAGSVLAEHKKRIRDGTSYTGFTSRLKVELGDVLWYLAILANDYELRLSDVATANLKKTHDRFAELDIQTPKALFDDPYPTKEQFPRRLTVKFRTLQNGRVQMYNGSRKIGASLSDNAHVEDGYRFHDALHLAFMAVLGWSPVMRSLLKRKRKSKPNVDEVEDGARALIIEEAVAALAYKYADDRSLLDGVVMIEYEFLATIRSIVSGFEVASLSSLMWERAILQGFEVFRHLNDSDGGIVYLDLENRSISIES